MEEWIQIRDLSRKGVSVSEIARQTGRDRKTVRKVTIEGKPCVERKVSKPKGSKLDPFKEYLLGRIDEGCLNSMVLLDEIIAQGYTGKSTILRDFVSPLRRELALKREATERFETAPGKQAQVDWAHFGRIWVPEEKRWRKLYMFLFTLGYSRAQYLEFTTSCDMEHFQQCHLGAFAALRIPTEILYDNLKTGILGRQEDGTAILPGRFADFALYYGFTPRFCKPYQARTKGKVERGVRYVRQNFWVRVAVEMAANHLTLAGLNERAKEWADKVANQRVHGTHGEVVWQRYSEEEPLLGKIIGRPPFDTSYRTVRQVGKDARLSYRGQIYQVGLRHALSEVDILESLNGEVTIRGKGGENIRWQKVTAGSVATREILDHLPTVKKAKGDQTDLMTIIYNNQPQVERRDLSVYEEVALAASVN